MEVTFKIQKKGTMHTSQGVSTPVKGSSEEQIYHCQAANLSAAENSTEDLQEKWSSL